MVLFTDFVPNPILKYNLGWLYVIEILIFLGYGLYKMMKPSFDLLKLYIWKYFKIILFRVIGYRIKERNTLVIKSRYAKDF